MDPHSSFGCDHNPFRGGESPQDAAPSDASQEDTDEDRKPPTLPASVVAVHRRHQSKYSSSSIDDNRSVSSQKSECGYYSSGPHDDGPAVAAYATSSLRSVGSVGSHGSGGHCHNDTLYAFAISSYAQSEAAKSDIATVCSGSVIEDIEVSSVDMNVPQILHNVVPSPHAERMVMVNGTSNLRRSVEFAPSSFPPSFQRQIAFHQTTAEYLMRTNGTHLLNTDQPLGLNDMGPPLSRALLMQRLQSTTNGSAAGSRPSSVKSFGSNGASQNSDMVADVDTDDCGGSLVESVTDGQSIHSQEDNRSLLESDPAPAVKTDMEEGKDDHDEVPLNGTHPLLQNGSSGGHPNGRTSPGGTIYKGKGVRRYQGRYMNLPLKRFHQDASADLPDTVLEADKVMEENKNRSPENDGGYESSEWHGRGRSPSPRHNGHWRDHRSTTPAHRNGYHKNGNNGYHTNGYHTNGYHKNGYHNMNGYNGFCINGYTNRETRSRSRSRSRSSSSENRRLRRRRRNGTNSGSPTTRPCRTSRHNNRSPSKSPKNGNSPHCRRSGGKRQGSRSKSQSRSRS